MQEMRVPPQDLDAEQSVLGSILLDREAIFRVMKILRPEDFYQEAHRLIYHAMLELSDISQPADLITVTNFLRKAGSLEQAGGVAYTASLANLVPVAANAEYYAYIVEEKALLRTLIQLATRIANLGYEGSEGAGQLLDQAERMIMEMHSRRGGSAFASIKEIVFGVLDRIQHAYLHREEITGVPTGFVELDRLTGGLQPGDLIILAGRPSMGKTALGLTVAQNVAVKKKLPVAVFSLEMSKEQLVQRLICQEAMVDLQHVRTGHLEEEDFARVTRAAGELAGCPLFIDDFTGITVRQIRARCRELQFEKGLSLVVIDYLQLMQGHGRVENRQQEIAGISRSLKGMAKELNLPVLALAQLSRQAEQRKDSKPQMADLRESGSLEQDADVVMFIYREEYYNKESDKKGIAEIIVAKQRNGPTGVAELAFLREFTRFVNLARREEEA
ncbi:MAG TPA: replicative DNA helicase [Spirochaetia bacterium]|nr:replicative DNA helicase [Spirochaetia bacterium]